MKEKKRSVISSRWLKEHLRDEYVRQAKKRKLRSRSWFKLDEIQKNKKLFKPGMTVVDLGSAPGGWSQYALTKICGHGRIIACDLLPMFPIIGVDFLQGDLRDELVFKALLTLVGKSKVQILMSDMAPNICGKSVVDMPHSIYLAELALELCRNILVTDGNFVVKVFYGNGFEEYLNKARSLFINVKIYKLESSRTRSREAYIVATGKK